MTRVLVGALIALILGWAPAAHARSAVVMPWPYDDVWPAGLRFLKLEEKVAITERDVEAGFIVFELSEDKKTGKGRMELVRVKDPKGRPSTRVVVALDGRPDYSEQGVLERFGRRLREDLGKPAEPPPPPPKTPPSKEQETEKDGKKKDDGAQKPAEPDPRDDGPPITDDLLTDTP